MAQNTAIAAQEIASGYATEGSALELGTVVVDGQVDPGARVRIPFATLNRHGLVAGATGTGKTKTLQGLAGQLSDAGVPVLLADVKGDLSGMAKPGEDNAKIQSRVKDTGDDWTPTAYPVEFLSLGGESTAVPIRATLTQFGPILLSKVLDLNETQESTLGLIFHWADQRNFCPAGHQGPARRHPAPDLRRGQGRPQGHRRRLVGDGWRHPARAGEPRGGRRARTSSASRSSTRTTSCGSIDGKGVVALLELADQAANPRLFSTFLMWLLAELYERMPEAGDLDKPKLVFFFDEAHLLFADASKAFLSSASSRR